MRMGNRIVRIAGVVACVAIAAGCKHKNEPNKILDGLPANPTVEVVPAQAAQQWVLLKRDMVNTLVPAVNKFANPSLGWGELGSPDGSLRYTYRTTNSRYGSATFQIQFHDQNGTPIPAAVSSSTTLKSVSITANAQSSMFTFSETLNLDVRTFGSSDSIMLLTGNSTVNGSNYSLTFSLPGSGAKCVFQGLSGGLAFVSGNGNGAPCNMTLNFQPNLDTSGTINWEGQSGTLRININGSGFVATNQERFFLR